jgi:hypothetical protein
MGADWYIPSTFYGYQIQVREEELLTRFIYDAYQIEVPKEFEIRNILTEFHSRMEGADNDELDELSTLVIGFTPDKDLEKTIELSRKLEKYIDEFTQLHGFTLNEFPEFYSGIEWYGEDWGDDDSEYDDTDEGCSDSDCDEEEEDEEEEDGSDSEED